jgi:chromosomal replication initiator protein
LYGGSGVGKTHLAYAIGNEVCRLNSDARVLYVAANTFKLQFQDAVNHNRVPDFLMFYQSVDVLIVDDIQYFADLKGTQDSFFQIFNHLQQSHKQLILTSDRSPLELRGVQDRLLSRFKWGLAAEITRPDYQLRHDILM